MISQASRQHFGSTDTWRDYRWEKPQQLRSQLTLDWLPDSVVSVLDAGCGNGMLTSRLRTRFPSVAVDLSYAALQAVPAPRCQVDVADLPFRSSGFDAVVTTEVLEHIPEKSYRAVLGEFVRVARTWILVSVPYCEDLEDAHIICPQCRCRFHKDYHIRTYSRRDMKGLFAAWPSVRAVRVEPISPTKRLKLEQAIKIAREARNQLGLRRAPFPATNTCPQCGYSRSATKANGGGSREHRKTMPRSFLKTYVAQNVWPRRDYFRWWLALYVKDSQQP